MNLKKLLHIISKIQIFIYRRFFQISLEMYILDAFHPSIAYSSFKAQVECYFLRLNPSCYHIMYQNYKDKSFKKLQKRYAHSSDCYIHTGRSEHNQTHYYLVLPWQFIKLFSHEFSLKQRN